MRKLIIPLIATALTALGMYFQALVMEPALMDKPNKHLNAIPGFKMEDVEISEAELYTLPKDTEFEKKVYISDNGNWFAVSMVIGGRSKSSIHRPELCLPSQGFQMTSPHTIMVNGDDWRVIRLERGNHPPLGFAYTFFNQAGFHTSSHIARIACDIWDRSILNRIDRWVMITVNTSSANDLVISDFLHKLTEAMQ